MIIFWWSQKLLCYKIFSGYSFHHLYMYCYLSTWFDFLYCCFFIYCIIHSPWGFFLLLLYCPCLCYLISFLPPFLFLLFCSFCNVYFCKYIVSCNFIWLSLLQCNFCSSFLLFFLSAVSFVLFFSFLFSSCFLQLFVFLYYYFLLFCFYSFYTAPAVCFLSPDLFFSNLLLYLFLILYCFLPAGFFCW